MTIPYIQSAPGARGPYQSRFQPNDLIVYHDGETLVFGLVVQELTRTVKVSGWDRTETDGVRVRRIGAPGEITISASAVEKTIN